MAKIDAFFNLMFEQKASDLHMASGNPPRLRVVLATGPVISEGKMPRPNQINKNA